MNFGDFMLGQKAYNEQLPTRDQAQISGIHNMLGMGLQNMQNPYEGFDPIAQQAIESYNQSIPSLAARFTSLSPSAMRSSGFQQALTRGQQGLNTNLAALRAQYGLQNRGQGMQMAQMGLTPTFENMYHPATKGFLGEMAGPLGSALLMGGMGAGIGHGIFGRTMMQGMNKGVGLGAMMPYMM